MRWVLVDAILYANFAVAEFVDINSDCLSGTLCVHGTRNYVVSSLL